MWRRGPDGHGTLCNACGVRWSRVRKTPGVQPVACRKSNRILSQHGTTDIEEVTYEQHIIAAFIRSVKDRRTMGN